MVDPVHRHRFLKGGPTARERFRVIFGIPEDATRRGLYRIAAVSWVEDALKVDVAGDGFGLASVWLLPPERDGYARTGGLTVSCEGVGRALPPPVERLLRHLAVRLAPATLERLFAALLADPDLVEEFPTPHYGGGSPAPAAPPGSPGPGAAEGDGAARGEDGDPGAGAPPDGAGRAPDRPPAAGVAEPWGEFFCDAAIEQNIAGSFHFRHPVVHLFHGSHECLFVSPAAPSRVVRFYNYPWDTARPLGDRRQREEALGRGPEAAAEGPAAALPDSHRRVSTDMDDLAVITGATDTLEDAVAHVLAGHRGEIVSVHCSCLPMVMGEDVTAATAALRDNPDVPYMYSDQVTDDQLAVVGEMLGRARAALRRSADPAGRVNLVGFPDGRATGELVGLLESLGATLNVALVPDLDLASYARLLDAELTVFLPSDRHRDLYRAAFEGFPEVRTLAPPAPWGLAATERWLAAVAAALGREDAAAAVAARAREALRPRWEALAACTAGARVGFVVDDRHAAKLLDPRRFFGLAVLELLREQGFGVDVLAWAPGGAVDYAPALQAAWGAASGLAVRPFADRAGLAALLSDDALRAVYTDFFFDDRLTTRGVAPLTARDFEPGFQGALRTFERLAGLARLPFYRRYAAALRRRRGGP